MEKDVFGNRTKGRDRQKDDWIERQSERVRERKIKTYK